MHILSLYDNVFVPLFNGVHDEGQCSTLLKKYFTSFLEKGNFFNMPTSMINPTQERDECGCERFYYIASNIKDNGGLFG